MRDEEYIEALKMQIARLEHALEEEWANRRELEARIKELDHEVYNLGMKNDMMSVGTVWNPHLWDAREKIRVLEGELEQASEKLVELANNRTDLFERNDMLAGRLGEAMDALELTRHEHYAAALGTMRALDEVGVLKDGVFDMFAGGETYRVTTKEVVMVGTLRCWRMITLIEAT